jgi:glutaredoxin-related protein
MRCVGVSQESTMPRPILDDTRLHPAIRDKVANLHAELVREVQAALAAHPVVVVGMRGNPFVKKARRALDAAGVAHHDLDYGSYFGDWRRRNALKMWTGWPTFPMVFVRGTLVGGADDVVALIASGELKRLLA